MSIELPEQLEAANAAYRAGNPVMSDAEYDLLVESLRQADPTHPFLHRVEPDPEGTFGGQKIQHASPMLSTEKAYDAQALAAFFKRVGDEAKRLGLPEPKYRITAKLDGLAGSRDRAHGVDLATRGNGLQGEDISRALARGLRIIGADVDGPGEIVMPRDFFVERVASLGFKHPRNFMVGFVAADETKDHHRLVADAGMAHFVPYTNLIPIHANAETILEEIEEMAACIREASPYDTDGVVIEVVDPRLRDALGSTNHHHRWQIAYKTQGEIAETTVIGVVWQTGRTGRITPVIEVEPVDLSGATIRRATAHNFKKARADGLGIGSRVTMIRSGEVIPYIVDVLSPAPLDVPDACPCCGGAVEEDGEYLTCINPECSAQAEGRIIHFFKTLGNADGFGPKAAEKIVAAGHTRLPAILHLTRADFEGMGFGPGQAQNLEAEIARCLQTPVEDWRFLAAFGLRHLGRGDSKALLLSLGGLDGLLPLEAERIMAVDGFAEKTAASIAASVAAAWPEIEAIRKLGIPLLISSAHGSFDGEANGGGESAMPLAGLSLVFTGTFSRGREDLEDEAERLGAKVQSSMNGKTSAVVVGEKPGASKTSKAAALGTKVWTEAEYLARLAG